MFLTSYTTMIVYKFWIPYQIVQKTTKFFNKKKNSHQTFCVFIILVRYHKQSTYVYIMLTFLALSRVCFRDIQFLCNPDWEVPTLTSMSFMKPKEQRNIINIAKRKRKQRCDYLTSTYDFVRYFAMGSRVIIGSIDFKNLWSNKCIFRYLMNMLDKIISYIKGLLNFSYPYTLKMSNKKVFVDFKQNTNPWKISLLLVKHKIHISYTWLLNMQR